MIRSGAPRATAKVALTVGLSAALATLVMLASPPERTARAEDDLGYQGDLEVKAGGGPVYEILRGSSVFFEKVPENVREREKCEKSSLSSDSVAVVTGQFILKSAGPGFGVLSTPKAPEVSCSFTRKDGGQWRFYPMQDSAWKRGNVKSSASKQLFAFGATNLGTPLEPKQRAVFRMKGKARLEKDNKNITLEAPFELVVGSKTRDRETGKYAGEYDALHEGYEVKLLIPETFEIPGHGSGLSIVFTSALASES